MAPIFDVEMIVMAFGVCLVSHYVRPYLRLCYGLSQISMYAWQLYLRLIEYIIIPKLNSGDMLF